MKRMFIIAIILLMAFTTVFSYASNEDISDVYEKTSNDITYFIDDMGIFDLISKIEDPIKKEMIVEYWTTPFYEGDVLPSEIEKKIILGRCFNEIQILIETPKTELKEKIKSLVSSNIQRISENKDLKFLDSAFNYADSLDIPVELMVNHNTAYANKHALNIDFNSELGLRAIISKVTTAQYVQGNPGQFAYLMIKCVVNWNYDSSTYNITSLVPNTSTGYAAPYTLSSYVVNEQWVENLSIDKGIVHKSVYVFSSLSPDRVGTLITDVSVRGNGSVVKNEGVFIPPTQQYLWSY